jgi:hypothetical protein
MKALHLTSHYYECVTEIVCGQPIASLFKKNDGYKIKIMVIKHGKRD